VAQRQQTRTVTAHHHLDIISRPLGHATDLLQLAGGE